MTDEDMAKLLVVISSATGKRFDEGEETIWRKGTADLSDEAVKRAVHRWAMERREWPTLADIRQYAVEATSGQLDEAAASFDRLTKAIRRYGSYDRETAKANLDPLTWAAMEAAGGWGWACDLTADNRQTYSAQFRMAYQTLSAREDRHRRLPVALRPAITNQTPLATISAAEAKPERRALPAPRQPEQEQLDRAKLLKVFREPVAPAAVPEQEEWDRRREKQLEAAKRLLPKTGG